MKRRRSNKVNKDLLEIILVGTAGFGIGSLTTLILNTIQTFKIRNVNFPKYKCNLTASIEPEIEKEEK